MVSIMQGVGGLCMKAVLLTISRGVEDEQLKEEEETEGEWFKDRLVGII
jgi:hypothetical protein